MSYIQNPGAPFVGCPSYIGTTAAAAGGPTTPLNGYVAEDGVTFYVAEDGATYYVQEF
jgi:hypothetical protein